MPMGGGVERGAMRSKGRAFACSRSIPTTPCTRPRLPRYHADPFDRMLIAQAQRRGLTLVTRDARLGAYGVATLLA
jgi:PIN domain nuclease of toxin-antitoxin system